MKTVDDFDVEIISRKVGIFKSLPYVEEGYDTL